MAKPVSYLAELLQAETLPSTKVFLPKSSKPVYVQTLLRHERPWDKKVPDRLRAVSKKPPIEFEKKLTWAEFVLVRLLERDKWKAAWAKNWGGRAYWRDIQDDNHQLPQEFIDKIENVRNATGRTGGCWDVVACRGSNEFLFIESKQKGRDDLNLNQKLWLECARRAGIPLSSFVIVQYQRQ